MTESQLATIWKTVLTEIKPHYSPATFKTWFAHASLLNLKPGEVDLAVENIMTRGIVQKYAEERLVASFSKHAGFPVNRINYIITPELKTKKATADTTQNLFEEAQVPVYTLPNQETSVSSNLNPKYTFSSFIVGNRNRLAHAAALAVAEKPGKMYNPLYLYGGVGLGKTHLMQAVGNEVIAREPQKRVLYLSCESFINEFVMSIKTGKQDSFKKKYRTVDVFLVDDIQFIAGKEGLQEEFFHTFNALYQTDKQIIIASDKTPGEIKGLEERLSSRFSSGMIADMQLPDLETRQAILQSKCQEKQVYLPDEIIGYIAEHIESNIRELEGALTRVLVDLQARQAEPTIKNVQQSLQSIISARPQKKTSLEQIRSVICEYYTITHEDLYGQRRQKELVKPRQILMYLLKHELNMTFPAIGREVGGRDHTTAMHSVDKIEKEMKKNPELREELQHIKELFYLGSRS